MLAKLAYTYRTELQFIGFDLIVILHYYYSFYVMKAINNYIFDEYIKFVLPIKRKRRNQMTNLNKVLSENELAQHLGLSPWTIRNLRLQQGLPHFRTSGRIFYRLASVEAWMSEKEQLQNNN